MLSLAPSSKDGWKQFVLKKINLLKLGKTFSQNQQIIFRQKLSVSYFFQDSFGWIGDTCSFFGLYSWLNLTSTLS